MKIDRKKFLVSAGILFSISALSPMAEAVADEPLELPSITETAEASFITACKKEIIFCQNSNNNAQGSLLKCIGAMGPMEASDACWTAFEKGGPSAEGGGPAFEGAGPAFEGGGPSFEGGGPAFEGGGPAFEGGGPAFEGGGPAFEGGAP